MKIELELSEDLHYRLRRCAKEEGISVESLVHALCKEHVEKEERIGSAVHKWKTSAMFS